MVKQVEEKINTPMVVSKTTHKRLTLLLGKREYYDDVIKMLLNYYEIRNKPSFLAKFRGKK